MSQRAAKGKAVWVGLWTAGLWVLLQATTALAAESPTRCRTACERHVTDPELRARTCSRCAGPEAHRAAWVRGLDPKSPAERKLLERALHDPDWRVGQSAVRALARHGGIAEEKILSQWMVSAVKGQDLERACLTVARVGAERGRSFAEWRKDLSTSGGKDGHHAFTVLARCEPRVRERLELEIYGMNPVAQAEALLHLAALTGRPPAVAALDALRGRPADADAVVAEVVLRVSRRAEVPVGRVLLGLEGSGPRRFAQRLIALYRTQAEQIAARLGAEPNADVKNRLDAVRDLAPLAPISASQLERLLSDPETEVREAAARAFAAGAGAPKGCAQTFVEKIRGKGGITDEARAAALKALQACSRSR